jgi:hypothetical protein
VQDRCGYAPCVVEFSTASVRDLFGAQVWYSSFFVVAQYIMIMSCEENSYMIGSNLNVTVRSREWLVPRAGCTMVSVNDIFT